MSLTLTLIETSKHLPAALGPDLVSAVDLAHAEKSVSTRKAYGTDFRLFRAWCDAKGVSSLPAAPETVAAYIAAEAQTAKPSTIGRRVAAIRYAHKLAAHPLPTDAEGVKATMRGIRRTHGSTVAAGRNSIESTMTTPSESVPSNITIVSSSRNRVSHRAGRSPASSAAAGA